MVSMDSPFMLLNQVAFYGINQTRCDAFGGEKPADFMWHPEVECIGDFWDRAPHIFTDFSVKAPLFLRNLMNIPDFHELGGERSRIPTF